MAETRDLELYLLKTLRNSSSRLKNINILSLRGLVFSLVGPDSTVLFEMYEELSEGSRCVFSLSCQIWIRHPGLVISFLLVCTLAVRTEEMSRRISSPIMRDWKSARSGTS